jgi:hypothetical protein
MSYELKWYVPQRVVFVDNHDSLTVEQLGNFVADITRDFLDHGTPPIHVISDLTKMSTFPTQLGQVNTMAKDFMGHPNMGALILINTSNNPLVRFIGSVVSQITGVEFYIVKNFEDAVERLKRLDPNLDLVDR